MKAAILAVGRVVRRTAAVGDALVPRRLMRVTMSCDHRVVDGATGAVNDVLRVHGDTHAYPLGISVGPRNVLLIS